MRDTGTGVRPKYYVLCVNCRGEIVMDKSSAFCSEKCRQQYGRKRGITCSAITSSARASSVA